MASNSNNRYDDDLDNWTPPSEAEMKVLEAKRERGNKISAIMGQYLLKGYKMLAAQCINCDCILLEDKNKRKYCVGCSEVDDDTKKDNPAVSEEAARSTVQELVHRQQTDNSTSLANISNRNFTSTTSSSLPSTSSGSNQIDNSNQATIVNGISSHSTINSTSKKDIKNSFVLNILRDKLFWATQMLDKTDSVRDSMELVQFMSETMKSIKDAKTLKDERLI